MFRIVEGNTATRNIVRMREMKPCEIGRIITSETDYHMGEIVMRTASELNHEVMSLSRSGPKMCWGENTPIKVELLPKGTEIKFIIE